VLAVKSALDQYEQQFRGAEAALYRQNSGSIRVRVIDDRFAGMPKSRRHDLAWQFLADRVGDEAMSEVSLLLLLPRSELGSSLMNVEFEHPTDSRL
jgi:stress-induced morphogen